MENSQDIYKPSKQLLDRTTDEQLKYLAKKIPSSILNVSNKRKLTSLIIAYNLYYLAVIAHDEKPQYASVFIEELLKLVATENSDALQHIEYLSSHPEVFQESDKYATYICNNLGIKDFKFAYTLKLTLPEFAEINTPHILEELSKTKY